MMSAKTQSCMYRTLAFLNDRGAIGAGRAEVREHLGLPKSRGHESRKAPDQRATEALMGAIHGAMTAECRGWIRTDGGRWFLTQAGIDAARDAQSVAPPSQSISVAGSYAEIHARAVAAEERAEALAEQLAEERKRREDIRRTLDRYINAAAATDKAVHALAHEAERKRRKAEKRLAMARRALDRAEALCKAIAAIPEADGIPF